MDSSKQVRIIRIPIDFSRIQLGDTAELSWFRYNGESWAKVYVASRRELFLSSEKDVWKFVARGV